MNKSSKPPILLAAVLAAFLAASLAVWLAVSLHGPRWGRSPGQIPADAACAECGMSVADPRFAAAIEITTGGVDLTLYFDDPGCVFDHERWNPDLRINRRWFAVDAAPAWMESGVVAFVIDPKIATPMGTGLQAIDPPAAARARAAGKRIEDFDGAAAFRRDWMESRFGKPSP